jgi:hypothetical protein
VSQKAGTRYGHVLFWRQKLGESQFKASLGKKLSEIPISINKVAMVVYAYDPQLPEGIGRRTMV